MYAVKSLSKLSRNVLGLAVIASGAHAFAQGPAPVSAELAGPSVQMIWMGGNDCPPCVAWRATELPKLSKSSEFQRIRFSYVTKSINASVPPAMFLPADVKPLKAVLDEASAGGVGSPQVAVVVNGVVFDYFYGTRSAEDVERMLTAIRTGTAYPFPRCIKMHRMGRSCGVPAPS